MFSLTLLLPLLIHADKPELTYRGDVLALRNTLIDCRRRARTPTEHIPCLRRATPVLNEILNDYFAERKAHLEPARVERLERAQEIWALFRDHECDDAHAETDEERLESFRCLWDETHARLYEVEKRTRTKDW